MNILRELGEMILGALKDWPIGTLIGILMIGLVLLLIAIVGAMVFTGLDFAWRERQMGIGRVTGREFIPAHTTTSTMMVGKVSIPTTHHHPDEWIIGVEIDGGGKDCVSVGQDFYNSAKEGDQLNVEYSTGRFTGRPNISSVSK